MCVCVCVRVCMRVCMCTCVLCFCSDERLALTEEARRAARDSDNITDVMRADIMLLLDMFGFPYLVCGSHVLALSLPMECGLVCACHLERVL